MPMPHPSRAEPSRAEPLRAGAAVAYCPGCGVRLDSPAAFMQEFWADADRHFLCWYPGCGLMCTVVISDRLLSHKPGH